MMRIKRKIILLMALFAAVLLVIGCGGNQRGQARGRNAKVNRAYTETESDAKEITMPVTFVNHTGVVICFLQASPADTDDWEEDILEDDILEQGKTVRVEFTYLSNRTVWDFAITDEDDEMWEYYDLDFKDYGEDGVTIVLNEDGTADIYEGADAYGSLADREQENTDTEIEVDYYEILLGAYYEMLEESVSDEEFQEMTRSDLALSYNLVLNLASIGYAFIDIDGNGTNELLIGCMESNLLDLNDDENYGVFISLYGLNEAGELEEIAVSNRRGYYYLCTDGMLGYGTISRYEGYDGDSFYQLKNGELLQVATKNHTQMKVMYTPFSQYQ